MHSDLNKRTKAIRFLIDQTRWQVERGDVDHAMRTLKLTKQFLLKTVVDHPEGRGELMPVLKQVYVLETMHPEIFALG